MAKDKDGLSDDMKEKIGANPTDYYSSGAQLSKETRNLYPQDIELRKYGFTIYSRPKDGEPIWKKGDRTYLQSVAIVAMERMKKDKELRGT